MNSELRDDEMFEYNINKVADNQSFQNACNKIEHHFPDCKKERLLIDVDGSMIQIYKKDDKKITVFNSYYIDAVYIKSEVNLNMLFKDAE